MKRAMEGARDFLTLPAWFPADKAEAVLRSKGKSLALIADRNGMTSVADRRQLASAPATKSVAWCATPLGPAVSPDVSYEEAQHLMAAHDCAYLPVVIGGVIIRIVARDVAREGGVPTKAPVTVHHLAA